jgi:hypothetical protein
MERRPIQDYFFFGTAVRYLQDTKAGTQVADFPGGWAVRSNLREVIKTLNNLNLKVSSLTDAATGLRRLLGELDKYVPNQQLSVEHTIELNTQIGRLRETVEAELRATHAYTLTAKRIDVSRLVADPGSLFAPGVFEKLPEIARYDIGEAGRCIAFELPTAAAFHLMRATEAVLRTFYASLIRRKRRARMWAEIIADIRAKRVGQKHTVLLNHLDHIRQAFRNPTQHPDARYNIHEVQDLWNVIVEVINRMASSL